MAMQVLKIATICTIIKFAMALNINEKQIEELEKKKSDLFVQINKEIDDSVNILKISNDTDSLLALNHMTELKKQINDFNASKLDEKGSSVKINETDNSTISESETKKHFNLSDVRRYGAVVSKQNKKIVLNLAEVINLLKKRDETIKVIQKPKEIKNELKIRQEIEEWILNKQKEKKKIEEYKQKLKNTNALFEKCPRFGTSKKKKRKFRRKGSGKKRGRKRSKKKKGSKQSSYPCCRKCCKMSYLGCL